MKMADIDRLNESFGNGIYVKVSYKDEIRKFKILDHEKPYDDILNVLSRQYDLDNYSNGNVRLSYIDDDLDEITVSSNREVVDALNSLSKNGCCIKLKIKDGADESGSDSGEQQPAQDMQPMLAGQGSDPIVKMETSEPTDLQMEIDNVIAGVRGSRNIGEEPVVVPNIFTSFQGKAKRQFEIEGGLVVCRLCPSGRTMAPTIDLNVIKSHTRSDIHIMALTYHVLGEWPALPSLAPFKQQKSNEMQKMEHRWRNLSDTTAAHLLAAKYTHHLNNKPIGQRRKRTSFSPATTLSLESFANSINWKRGESEKINEFAQKHGLTFYQVKVWMNNHRPRKTMAHHNANGSYLPNMPSLPHLPNMTNTGFYTNSNTAEHAREINKVIAALEEPLQNMKTEMNVPVNLANTFNISPTSSINNAALSNALGLSIPTSLSSLSSLSSLNIPTSLSLPTTLGSLPTTMPTTLGIFGNSNMTVTAGSPPKSESPNTSPLAVSLSGVSSPFFSHPRFSAPFSAPFSLPTITSSNSLASANSIVNAINEHISTKTERCSPGAESNKLQEPFKSSHPLSLENVSLDSAFRPPTFTNNLHTVFTRHAGQESTSSGS